MRRRRPPQAEAAGEPGLPDADAADAAPDAFYRVPLSSSEALATLAVVRGVCAAVAARRVLGDLGIEADVLQSAAARIAGEVPDFVSDRADALAGALAAALESGKRRPGGEEDDEEEDEPAPPDAPPFPIRRTRRLLEDAFENDVPVEIEYFIESREEWTTRRVDIRDVFAQNDAWYLSGHCGLRGDFRQFRLDHIRSVRVLDTGEDALQDPFAAE